MVSCLEIRPRTFWPLLSFVLQRVSSHSPQAAGLRDWVSCFEIRPRTFFLRAAPRCARQDQILRNLRHNLEDCRRRSVAAARSKSEDLYTIWDQILRHLRHNLEDEFQNLEDGHPRDVILSLWGVPHKRPKSVPKWPKSTPPSVVFGPAKIF